MSIRPLARPWRLPGLLVFLGALGGAAPAWAEAPSPPLRLRLDLREATRRGAEHGPDLAVARAPLPAIHEARRAADVFVPTPPRVSLAAGGRHSAAGSGPELSVTVLQDIPLAGIAGARRQVAAGLAEVARLETRSAEERGAARAALAWVGMAEADRVLALREEARAQAEALLKLAEARVKSGVADPLEGELARSELATARAAALDAEGQVFDASAELRFAVGLTPDADIDVVGDVEALVDRAADEAAVLAHAQREHPALQGLLARRETARDEARLALATQAPSLGVGASYVREGTGDQVWTGVVTVPLPFVHPGSFDAARLRAGAAIYDAEHGRAQGELAREIHLVMHEREHARELFAALGGVLGPSKEALRLATVQLAAGTLDISRVLQARARVLAASEQRTHAAADAYRADLRLDSLQGTLVPRTTR
jgi:cobalt-zinc-cadmium efflux system outer membrane protein